MTTRYRTTWLLLAALAIAAAAVASPPPERVRATFTVEGMHCDGCSATITATLRRVKGVEDAGADHEAGSAWAVFEPTRTSAPDLAKEIEKLGYTVTATVTDAAGDKKSS